METKDTPQGLIGFKFAQALVDGEYERAHRMLSDKLKVEIPVSGLKQEYEDMISLVQWPSQTDLPEIQVMNNYDLGNAFLDSEGWAYIAIFSEAVTITVQLLGTEYLITELIWGRP